MKTLRGENLKREEKKPMEEKKKVQNPVGRAARKANQEEAEHAPKKSEGGNPCGVVSINQKNTRGKSSLPGGHAARGLGRGKKKGKKPKRRLYKAEMVALKPFETQNEELGMWAKSGRLAREKKKKKPKERR